MQLKASNVEDYSWIYRGDPALASPEPGDFLDEDGEPDDKAFIKAVERFNSEIEAALESEDFSRIPVKDGQKLTIFTLRHLRGPAARFAATLMRIEDPERRVKVLYIVAAAGLVDAESLYDTGGKRIRITHSISPDGGFRAVDDDVMDLLCDFDHGGLVNALGWTIANDMYSPKKKPSKDAAASPG